MSRRRMPLGRRRLRIYPRHGRLSYAHELILEAYYRVQWAWTVFTAPIRLQLSPDFQYIQNPGFNQDLGPVRFYSVRAHLEY